MFISRMNTISKDPSVFITCRFYCICKNIEDELRALAASVRALSYGTNMWGSAEYRRRISAPLAIQAVRRAAGIELSAALARELEGVQIPKHATDEYSCRRVPGVDSSEVR